MKNRLLVIIILALAFIPVLSYANIYLPSGGCGSTLKGSVPSVSSPDCSNIIIPKKDYIITAGTSTYNYTVFTGIYSVDNMEVAEGTRVSSTGSNIPTYEFSLKLSVVATSTDISVYKNKVIISGGETNKKVDYKIESSAVDRGSYYLVPANSIGRFSCTFTFDQSDIDRNSFNLDLDLSAALVISPAKVAQTPTSAKPVIPTISISNVVISPVSIPQYDKATVSWKFAAPTKNVDVELWRNGSKVNRIVSFVSGSYTDRLSTATAGDGYTVKVIDSTNSQNYAESKPFSITPSTFTVSVGSGPFFVGDTLPITWTQRANTKNVKIDLYKGTTLIKNISASVSVTKKQNSYVLPKTLVPGNDYSVRVTDKVDVSVVAVTPQFEIKKPEISIMPTLANVLVGQHVTFMWSYSGKIKSFTTKLVSVTTGKVVVSKDIPASISSYTWPTTTKTPLGSYKLIVSDSSDKTVVAESNPFNIVNKMQVSEAAPTVEKTVKKSSLLGNVWSAIMNWFK